MNTTDEQLDALLASRELVPDNDFSQRLLQIVLSEEELILPVEAKTSLLKELALIGGGLIGLVQSLYFVFGVWLTTSAV